MPNPNLVNHEGLSGRVRLDLRVAIIGHRWLSVSDENVDAVAREIRQIRAKTFPSQGVGVTVVSALAEGADRLAGHAALRLDGRIEALLPLAVEDYVNDFETDDSRADFTELLAAAASVDIVPSAETRTEAYRAAATAAVDRSDVVLALWDGRPASGVGGTGETIAYADSRGVPVWWLVTTHEQGIGPRQELAPRPEESTTQERTPTPFPATINLLSPTADRALRRYNARTVDLSASDPLGSWKAAAAFQAPFARADQTSIWFQRILRQSSRAIYTLAVVAVAVVAGQLVFFRNLAWLTWIEVVCLAAITVILIAGRRLAFLARWLEARQLAELIRTAALLGALGLTSPPSWGSAVAVNDWVDRAIKEVCWRRHVEPEHGDTATLRAAIERDWFLPQIRYHETANRLAIARQRRVVPVTVGLFALSLLTAVFHSLHVLAPEGSPDYWAYISIVVPTAAAAIGGYAGQREYLRQAIRSRRAITTLTRILDDVRVASTREALGRAVIAVQRDLAAEAQDWSTTATLHDLEVP